MPDNVVRELPAANPPHGIKDSRLALLDLAVKENQRLVYFNGLFARELSDVFDDEVKRQLNRIRVEVKENGLWKEVPKDSILSGDEE